MKKIFWRSKENELPPSDADFFIQPFRGERIPFKPEILSSLPLPSLPIPVISRVDSPTKKEWICAVEKALLQIKQGLLQKVVLARQTTFTFAEAPDPFQVLAALEKKAKGAALFCLQFDRNTSFLGASPERLFQRKGKEILFDAIAGTREKGPEMGPEMGQELLSSEKDLREFQFVQDYLDETLHPFCREQLTFSKLALHNSANVQHLFSQGKGVLNEETSDRDLLEKLHPTPAVCGTPKKLATEWIQAEEPFDRNFYSGVIGWSTQDSSDWTVAIRSCFLTNKTAQLYTGTGIVAGSDPEKEWDELEAKLALYEEIFPCGHL